MAMFAAWQDDNREQFWAEALCDDGTGSLVALFFSEQLDDIARAKAICGECAVREECFDGALSRREPFGVWGGQLFLNGKVLAHKRPRGRPRKHPRPDSLIAS
jgi:WhiB family redox-sensing transcriptional regulator